MNDVTRDQTALHPAGEALKAEQAKAAQERAQQAILQARQADKEMIERAEQARKEFHEGVTKRDVERLELARQELNEQRVFREAAISLLTRLVTALEAQK